MAGQIFTTREIAYGHYGFRSYRIEIDISDPHRTFQRHIWTTDSGEVDAEDWIPGIRETADQLLARGYRKAA